MAVSTGTGFAFGCLQRGFVVLGFFSVEHEEDSGDGGFDLGFRRSEWPCFFRQIWSTKKIVEMVALI
ncbi:hypothetical protein L1987_24133 [Smallanthus sonchifolius]|uniref:Uncharacterized protein n=1 Tax=Smallanthus sonchifolius TaxID=185202 RepID=A0ACB9IL31_9ASTR|nr:hypothetical protein L1987_24133 [Smallanthus sonchifolius]